MGGAVRRNQKRSGMRQVIYRWPGHAGQATQDIWFPGAAEPHPQVEGPAPSGPGKRTSALTAQRPPAGSAAGREGGSARLAPLRRQLAPEVFPPHGPASLE